MSITIKINSDKLAESSYSIQKLNAQVVSDQSVYNTYVSELTSHLCDLASTSGQSTGSMGKSIDKLFVKQSQRLESLTTLTAIASDALNETNTSITNLLSKILLAIGTFVAAAFSFGEGPFSIIGQFFSQVFNFLFGGSSSGTENTTIDDATSDAVLNEAGEVSDSETQTESATQVPTTLYMGNNYPYSKSENGKVDKWNFYVGQCTSYVAWCLNEAYGINFTNYYKGQHFGNAKTWIQAAQNAGIQVDDNPVVGSVACSTSGEYGHVAWVAEVKEDTVVIEEYNYNGSSYHKREVSKNEFQYIHFENEK